MTRPLIRHILRALVFRPYTPSVAFTARTQRA